MRALTTDEHIKLEVLRNLQDSRCSDARFNSGSKRVKLINRISRVLLKGALGLKGQSDDYEDKITEVMRGTSVENEFALSIATAIVSGYLQLAHIDIALDRRPEFGFAGLDAEFRSGMAKIFSEVTPEGESTKLLADGLYVTLRDCSVTEYFEDENMPYDDINTLYDLLNVDIDEGYNKRMLEALATVDDTSSIVKSYMKDIPYVYRLVFEESFGLEVYKGVLGEGGNFLTIEGNSSQATPVKESPAILRKFADRLYSKISGNIKFSKKRQFDYAEIFAEKRAIVYFPYKILEYALGRESTLNLQDNVYNHSANSAGWDNYYDNYVDGNLTSILYRGIYKALEMILLESKAIKNEFASVEFSIGISNYVEFVQTHIGNPAIYEKIGVLIGRLVSSIKSAYLLTKYPYLAGNVAAINFRVCQEPWVGGFTADAHTSVDLFKSLVSVNAKEEFNTPICIADGEKSEAGKAVSVCIYEYQYDIDPLLTKAEPLFGYTVQRANQKKGVEASWKNILIGQSMSGKELYAAPNNAIHLQNHLFHNIIAGSRSGKGVMTMNILVSALAAGRPVFYLDRKPDMASMLYSLAGDSQFIVNGQEYKSDNDLGQYFKESTGAAMKTWRESPYARQYLVEHPEIAELFNCKDGNPVYTSVIGDYVYFRALMFCFGLLVLRTKLSGESPECDRIRKEIFNGNDGLVIVVDELTGVQSGLAEIFSNFDGDLVQAGKDIESPDEIIAAREAIMKEINYWEQKASEAKQESGRMQAENKGDKERAKLNKLVDQKALYAATLYEKLRKSHLTWGTAKRAGFVQKEELFSDVFVLGQDLDATFFIGGDNGSLSSVFFPLKSGGDGFYNTYVGADVVRSFIEEMGCADWFLGRNKGKNYAKKLSNPEAERVLDEDGNWGYVGVATCREITGKVPTDFKYVLFKPYLVLNNSRENTPPTEVEGVFQYVAQCAGRVNKTAKNDKMWESVRLKHLADPNVKDYDHLDEGLGFEGLVKATMATKKDVDIENVDVHQFIIDILKRSGEAANFVAQAMGYTNWQELVYDFRPQGLFSFDDIVTAVMKPEAYTPEYRLPIYAKLGVMPEDFGGSTSGEEDDLENAFADRPDFGSFRQQPDMSGAGAGAQSFDTPTGSGTPVTPSPTGEMPAGTSAQDAANVLWGSFPSDEPDDEGEDPEDDPFGDWDDDDSPAPAPASPASPMMAMSEVQNYVSLAIELVIEFLGEEYGNYTASERKEFMTRAFDILSAS